MEISKTQKFSSQNLKIFMGSQKITEKENLFNYEILFIPTPLTPTRRLTGPPPYTQRSGAHQSSEQIGLELIKTISSRTDRPKNVNSFQG